MLCTFCLVTPNSDLIGRKELASFIVHLAEIHHIFKEKAVLLAVNHLDLEDVQFVESSLVSYNQDIDRSSNKVTCIFCNEDIFLDREIGGNLRMSSLTIHIRERHFVINRETLLVEMTLLLPNIRSEVLDTFLFQNGFRTNRYNQLHAMIRITNSLELEDAKEKKFVDLQTKLESIMTGMEPGERKRRYKVRKDKGIKKGKMDYALNRPKKVFSCSYCNYKTPQNKKLKRHVRIHTQEKPYICMINEECEEKFKSSSELHQHRRRKHTHEKNVMCNDCGKTFVERSELTRHSKTHLEVRIKSLKCGICAYSTDTATDLRRHEKYHRQPDKTFDCNQCNKKFRSRPHLQRHEKTHNVADKLYKCVQCDKSFMEKYNVKQHIINVHEPIPDKFMCLICNAKFRKRCDLNHHEATKHLDPNIPPPQFLCDQCNKYYPHQQALRRHKHLKHVLKPKHLCNVCDILFKTKSKLNRHIQSNIHVKKESLVMKLKT